MNSNSGQHVDRFRIVPLVRLLSSLFVSKRLKKSRVWGTCRYPRLTEGQFRGIWAGSDSGSILEGLFRNTLAMHIVIGPKYGFPF